MKFYIIECKSKAKFPIVGWLIQLIQGCLNFHHYALIIETNDGKHYTYDASSRTLHRESIENFADKYEIVRTYEIPYSIDQSAFFRWIFPLEGTVYGHSQILGLFLMVLNLYTKNPFPNGMNKLICNEFVLSCLHTFQVLDIPNIENYDLVKTRKLLESNFESVDIYQILSSYNIR